MSNEITVFNNRHFGCIRTVVLNGEPYFVGKDIAEALGYRNPRKAIADHVDAEDKTDGVTIRDAIGREQTPIIINESGLYSLIMSSKLPNARQFKRWVTSEVLPSIRKTGSYGKVDIQKIIGMTVAETVKQLVPLLQTSIAQSNEEEEAAIGFLQSFINGIANNSSKLVQAAKDIVKALVDGLVKLLPSEVQKPVKETVSILRKSFESGGLKKAIETVRTILVNLGKAATNVAKVILPPLAKAVDLVGKNFKTLLPIVTSVYAAYKSYQIIATLTALFKTHTAAVTAESLAEAASLGTITLKQIAVGALTGEITLATAAQYAWNLAMSMNPIGIVVMAVAALAAGVATLAMTMSDAADDTDSLKAAQERLAQANENLGSSYEEIGDKFSGFMDEIESSGSILDGFNENILISDADKQALNENMDSVQGEITEICRLASDERRELTGGEITRLEELFEKMHELTEQELAIEQAKQEVVTTAAEDLCNAADIGLDEYTERSKEIAHTAEETRLAVINKAEEQYTEELALLKNRYETQSDYSDEQYEKDREAARKSYQAAIDEANQEAGDTLAILEKGYYDRAYTLQSHTGQLNSLNKQWEKEESTNKDNVAAINEKYNKTLDDFLKEEKDNRIAAQKYKEYLDSQNKELEEESTRHAKEQGEIKNEQAKLLSDKNYQNQLTAFGNLEALYETYTGKTGEHSEAIINAFYTPMDNMDDEVKEKFEQAVNGAIEGIDNKKESLFYKAQNLVSGFVSIFTKGFDEHSPSKVFKKIFKYTMEGAEIGTDEEKEKLFKQADDIGGTYTKRMQLGLDTDSFVSKMRAGVEKGRAMVAQTLTANVVHKVNVASEDSNRKFILKGDVITKMDIDGREFAVATAPYMSEEIAWEGDY